MFQTYLHVYGPTGTKKQLEFEFDTIGKAKKKLLILRDLYRDPHETWEIDPDGFWYIDEDGMHVTCGIALYLDGKLQGHYDCSDFGGPQDWFLDVMHPGDDATVTRFPLPSGV